MGGRGRSPSIWLALNVARGCTVTERRARAESGVCDSTFADRRGSPAGLCGREAGWRDVMDSTGVVSAMAARGTLAVGVGSGSGPRGISVGGETGGTGCEEDEVGTVALIAGYGPVEI